MMPPMHQVNTGDVPPAVAAMRQIAVLEDIHKVVLAPPVDTAIWVKGHGKSFWHNEMIDGPVRVFQKFGSQLAGVFYQLLYLCHIILLSLIRSLKSCIHRLLPSQK